MSVPLPEEPIYSENPVVHACMKAWNDDYQMSKNSGMKDYECKRNANAAYRAAMPDFCDEESILDFIACVGRGILLEVFDFDRSAKLIAAAQAARRSAEAIRRQQQEEENQDKPPETAEAENFLFSEKQENI